MAIANLQYSAWVFKDNIDFTGFEDFNFEIDFSSYNPVGEYNDNFTHLVVNVKENKLSFVHKYDDYSDEHNTYDGTTWLNEKCKTIVITGGKDKTNKYLIAFLEKNATLITKVSNFKNSKWLLNETLDDSYFDEVLYIKSNNQNFTYVYREGGYGLEYYDENDESVFVYEDESGWVNQAYRTIEVLGGALEYNNPQVWLLKNATLLEEQPIALKEYLTDIANSIRKTKVSTEKINGQDFANEIINLPTINNFVRESGKGCKWLFAYFNGTESDLRKYLNSINTADVYDFSEMFDNCEYIENIPPINTDNASDMYQMFAFCKRLKTIDITKMASNNTRITWGCSSLTKFIIRTMDTIPTFGVQVFSCEHFDGTYNEYYNPNSLRDGRIYVPDDKVEELKATAGWSDYADIIVPLSTLEE